jgi:hypothetical protein
MKKTFMLLSFVVVLVATTALATAGSAVVVRGEIPFDFYVGEQMLPSGEYQFEMGGVRGSTTSSITVREKDGTVVAFVTTRQGDSRNMDSTQLKFENYKGKYFLSSVECSGYKAVLRKVRLIDQSDTVKSASVIPKQ